jgi:hypothetical protein
MEEEIEQINCSEHGEANTAYVCEHLIANPVQQWHSDYPSEDSPWPDAWCSACNAEYLKEGGWSERNEDKVSIKTICHYCYENARSDSVDYIEGDSYGRWQKFVSTCCEEFHEKNDMLSETYSLGEHKRYDWDQEKGELIFSNDGIPAVIAKIDFVGSFSSKSNTWLWAWANFHLLENVRLQVEKVREFGEAQGFPRLTTAKWVAEESDGWEMSAVAARVLDAKGIYLSPRDGGATFMIIKEIRKVC